MIKPQYPYHEEFIKKPMNIYYNSDEKIISIIDFIYNEDFINKLSKKINTNPQDDKLVFDKYIKDNNLKFFCFSEKNMLKVKLITRDNIFPTYNNTILQVGMIITNDSNTNKIKYVDIYLTIEEKDTNDNYDVLISCNPKYFSYDKREIDINVLLGLEDYFLKNIKPLLKEFLDNNEELNKFLNNEVIL